MEFYKCLMMVYAIDVGIYNKNSIISTPNPLSAENNRKGAYKTCTD